MVTKRVNVTLPEELTAALGEYGLSPSRLLQEAVRAEVERREALKGGEFREITVELSEGASEYSATFLGRWLVEPGVVDGGELDVDDVADADRWDAGVDWGVAVTAKGRVAVYGGSRRGQELSTFETLEAAEDAMPSWVYRAAQGTLAGSVRLDI